MLSCPKCSEQPFRPSRFGAATLTFSHFGYVPGGDSIHAHVRGPVLIQCSDCETLVAHCYLDYTFQVGLSPRDLDDTTIRERFESISQQVRYFNEGPGWKHVDVNLSGTFYFITQMAEFKRTIRIPAYHFHRVYGL